MRLQAVGGGGFGHRWREPVTRNGQARSVDAALLARHSGTRSFAPAPRTIENARTEAVLAAVVRWPHAARFPQVT